MYLIKRLGKKEDVKNKIPDVSGLVSTTVFNTKIEEVEENPNHDTYATQEINKLMAKIFLLN